MNTFFRICVYFLIAMFVFTLAFNLINITGAFKIKTDAGVDLSGDTTNETLKYTSLDPDDQNMNYLFGSIAGGTIIGLLAAWLAKSVVPLGVALFGSVFWASYISAFNVINVGEYLPGELLIIFTAVSVFMFIGAIVGMFTGSG